VAGPFEKLMGSLEYPLFVVTACGGGERSGCLVGFATQTSIHPPRFLACISQKNHTHPVAEASEVLAVHVLSEAEHPLAELFGGETGDEIDKFERVGWHPGPGGVPILEGVDGWFAGRVLERHELGDHTGFLLEPLEAEGRARTGEELGFQEGKQIEPGHRA
jgi:flavin reductase (DIM6/NTAB) family NADH-FMN oxidoreductase RutF